MTESSNEKLIRDLYQAFDDNNLDEAFSMIDNNVEFRMMSKPGEPLRGMKDFRSAYEKWSKAFPGMKAEITNIVSSGDIVVVEAINRGKHEGALEGPKGILEPTHREVEVPECDVFKISGGKVRSWTLYWQGDLMMEQLGVLPQKKAAA